MTPDGKRRDSVGAIIGVTPRKGAVNLQKAKAADAAAAAAARLDGFGAEAQRGITKRKTRRKSKKQRRRDSYTPRSRESMHLLTVTEGYLNSEDERNDREEKEEEAALGPPPPLLSDVEEKTDDGAAEDGASVIATPGPYLIPTQLTENLSKTMPRE